MIQALRDAVTNADIAESFTILRNPGTYGAGGWQGGAQQTIQAYGTVGLASNKDIQALPEADRVNEVRLFHSTTKMYVTSGSKKITADILVWHGINYRVAAELPQDNRGYHGALAVRMAGD